MRPLIHIIAILWLSAAALLAQAQNLPESPNNGPWRTSTQDGQANVMLEGHDAVAYFTQNDAVRGKAEWSLQHQGVTWLFASEANRAEFQKSPEKYMPQFGGFCTNGINYAIPWGGGGGPNTWRIYRGKLYVFGGQSSRDHFEMETERNLQLAHQYWNEQVAGSNAVWTRYKRLVFRVPHYKTGKELQSEYEAKLAAKTLPVMPGAPQVVPAK
jgi:YHS domain-containing protein